MEFYQKKKGRKKEKSNLGWQRDIITWNVYEQKNKALIW